LLFVDLSKGESSDFGNKHESGMLIFLDESFRTNQNTKREFGVLAGVAIPEDIFHDFQLDFFKTRRPYHGQVLKEGDEVHGKELLSKATLKRIKLRGASQHWGLAEKLLHLARSNNIKTFGVVCFRPQMKSFVCGDESSLDVTFRYLFERIDNYMKLEFPGRTAKLIFDNRDHKTHEANYKLLREECGWAWFRQSVENPVVCGVAGTQLRTATRGPRDNGDGLAISGKASLRSHVGYCQRHVLHHNGCGKRTDKLEGDARNPWSVVAEHIEKDSAALCL